MHNMTLINQSPITNSWQITCLDDLLDINHFNKVDVTGKIETLDKTKPLRDQLDQLLSELPDTYSLESHLSYGGPTVFTIYLYGSLALSRTGFSGEEMFLVLDVSVVHIPDF